MITIPNGRSPADPDDSYSAGSLDVGYAAGSLDVGHSGRGEPAVERDPSERRDEKQVGGPASEANYADGFDVDRVTFGITCFDRPQHLERLIHSIRAFYPTARIVVADNGRRKAIVPSGVRHLALPYDCGLSAARNALIDRLDTDFLLVLEEDFLFTHDTQLARFADVLTHDQEVGAVTGALITNGLRTSYAADFDPLREVLRLVPANRPARTTSRGTRYAYCDVGYNFGLFRGEFLRAHRWNESLKLGEHTPFYWEVHRARQWRVAYCPQVAAIHDRSGRTPEYLQLRGRAKRYKDQFLQEAGIKKIVLEPELTSRGPTPQAAAINLAGLGENHYQPFVADRTFWTAPAAAKLTARGCERQCLDRAAAIFDSPGLLPGTLLDVGCNIGFFTHYAAARGFRAVGIDNGAHVRRKRFTTSSSIATARQLSARYEIYPEFKAGDYRRVLVSDGWDYVLYLSVWHHHLIRYGSPRSRRILDEAEALLRRVFDSCRRALFFEFDYGTRRNIPGWRTREETFQSLVRLLRRSPRVIHHCDEPGKNGVVFRRDLWRIDRRLPDEPLPFEQPVPLGSSRKRNVGYLDRAAGVLRISREANDWSNGHPYGVAVRRRPVIAAGRVLALLRDHPHPNVMRILDFDEDWVWVEWIEGLPLSNREHYVCASPSEFAERLRKSRCRLDDHGVDLSPLGDAMRHLHAIGVAHTDIAGFNVIVTPSGQLKLIDLVGAMPLDEELRALDERRLNEMERELRERHGPQVFNSSESPAVVIPRTDVGGELPYWLL